MIVVFGVGRREFEGFQGEVLRRFDKHDEHVKERHLENQRRSEEIRDDVRSIYRLLWRGIAGLVAILLAIAAAYFKVHS